jgi:pimeloyl-ACP methyl ester carboxylesterase
MSDVAAAGPSWPASNRNRRRLGVLGTVLGVAAAGLAAGIAAERTLVKRIRNDPADPHAREPFGRLPFDESLTVPTTEGADLYVEIVEPADGVELDAGFAARVAATVPSPEPTLVFVHGFCLDMGTFHFQRKELTRRGDWRAVYYDQPGHGRSEALPTGDYELPALGDALKSVLDATTPAGPVVLVGHSMGGMVIMALAERYPEMFARRVSGAVLIATSAGRLEGVTLGMPETFARFGKPLLPLVAGASRVGGGVIDRARLASSDLAWLLTRRYGFGSPQPSPGLVSYVEQMNSRTSFETVSRYLRTLYSHARYPALESLRDKPVLLICGDGDPITPLAHTEAIKEHLPDAELIVVPDSGHVVLMEHAEEVNAALLSFLEKIE